jgi:D-arabinose 1-dehydrogenase-like Zn-dependent alcohol dehydrogenase
MTVPAFLLLLLLLQVGLGGLGHMAVKFGVAFGCKVYVISRWAACSPRLQATMCYITLDCNT